jgi:hypothetical protein
MRNAFLSNSAWKRLKETNHVHIFGGGGGCVDCRVIAWNWSLYEDVVEQWNGFHQGWILVIEVELIFLVKLLHQSHTHLPAHGGDCVATLHGSVAI